MGGGWIACDNIKHEILETDWEREKKKKKKKRGQRNQVEKKTIGRVCEPQEKNQELTSIRP